MSLASFIQTKTIEVEAVDGVAVTYLISAQKILQDEQKSWFSVTNRKAKTPQMISHAIALITRLFKCFGPEAKKGRQAMVVKLIAKEKASDVVKAIRCRKGATDADKEATRAKRHAVYQYIYSAVKHLYDAIQDDVTMGMELLSIENENFDTVLSKFRSDLENMDLDDSLIDPDVAAEVNAMYQ